MIYRETLLDAVFESDCTVMQLSHFFSKKLKNTEELEKSYRDLLIFIVAFKKEGNFSTYRSVLLQIFNRFKCLSIGQFESRVNFYEQMIDTLFGREEVLINSDNIQLSLVDQYERFFVILLVGEVESNDYLMGLACSFVKWLKPFQGEHYDLASFTLSEEAFQCKEVEAATTLVSVLMGIERGGEHDFGGYPLLLLVERHLVSLREVVAKGNGILWGMERSFVHYKTATIELSVASGGNGTGIGSIRKGDLVVGSFGPHALPLGFVESRFGVTNDIRREIEEVPISGGHQLKVWHKFIGDREKNEKHVWIESTFKLQGGRVDYSSFFVNLGEKEDLYMVFFVQCEGVFINKTEQVAKESLTRFEAPGEEITLKSGQEELTIELDSERGLKIIPLSGGEFFWAMNYLVAIEVDANLSTLSMQIN